MYINKLSYLSSEAFSVIPSDLISDLRQLLSMDAALRPSPLDFTGSSFFRDDTRLRALRFLDHMLERDNMQKSEFLKALSSMWKDFDSRVLRYKVLPPLCAELRNLVTQHMILPMVLTIAESQDKDDFELSTFPALVSVFTSASGDTLLLLVKHSELIINKASHENLMTNVLPMLVRAYDDTDARIQEEVLKRTVTLAKQLDLQLVKQAILPRVHSLALRTTIAAVRVNALHCLGDMVSLLDKHAVLDILETLQRCTAVDRSAPTLMCTLAIANFSFKKHGLEFAAEHIIPLLSPLLTAQQLNVQQFAKYMHFVKDILRKIEEKRGVSVSDSVNSETRVPSSVPNGHQHIPKATTSTKTNSPWDEDWGPISKASITSSITPESKIPSMTTITVGSHPSVNAFPMKSSVSVSDQQTPTCPSVDIEWPPRNSSSTLGSLVGDNSKRQIQQSGSIPDVTFDDMDPFANWPPKSTNQGVGMGSGINPIPNLGSSGLKYSTGQPTQQRDGSLNMNRTNGSSAIGMSNSSSAGSLSHYSMNASKKGDIGSIFNSSNNENSPMRIAPPPTTLSGRGRGKIHGHLRPPPPSSSQANHPTSRTGQSNLLDLL